MTAHDDFLGHLRRRSPALVDAALAHRLPTLGAALSLDEDDCLLVMRRARRIADAIIACDGWVSYGSMDDDTHPCGSTSTSLDGSGLTIERPAGRSKADPNKSDRIETIHARPGMEGRIRIVGHLATGSEGVRPDRSHALAMCIAAHRISWSTTTDEHQTLMDLIVPSAQHLATLLSHTLRPDLEPGRVGGPATAPLTVVVRTSDGARRLGVRIMWNPTSRNDVRLDEDTYERLTKVFPTAFGLAVDHGLNNMHSSIGNSPNTRIILSQLSAVAKVPSTPADGVAVMRALSALGLDTMPTLVRRPKQ